MLLGELNFLIIIFLFLFTSIIININTAIHLLLTAELLWITLYSIVFIIGTIYDNVNFLSLTFFFLILSAVEFAIGLVLILLQNIFNRSINLNDTPVNMLKFSSRFLNKLNINTFKFI